VKAYTVLSALGRRQGADFLEDFLSELKQHIAELNIYYTTIPSTKIPSVRVYGNDRTGVQEMKPMAFLDKLIPSYAHCCAWKYAEDHVHDTTPLVSDYFEGEETDAWRILRGLPSFTVYFGGDNCNCYVSVADIIARITDERIYRNRAKLFKGDIESLLSDLPVQSVFIDQLGMIAPVTKNRMDVAKKLAHPVIFIVKEGIESQMLGASANERDLIEESPLMTKVFNLAYELDGCYKFFDSRLDQSIIREEDYLLCLGANGLGLATYMRNLGYKFNVLDSRKLMKGVRARRRTNK
jgi:hypothetical protein